MYCNVFCTYYTKPTWFFYKLQELFNLRRKTPRIVRAHIAQQKYHRRNGNGIDIIIRKKSHNSFTNILCSFLLSTHNIHLLHPKLKMVACNLKKLKTDTDLNARKTENEMEIDMHK